MEIYRVFQRIPDDPNDLGPWRMRIDQLLFSDPRELLQFISDALIALAAQAKDEETAFEDLIQLLSEMNDIDERDNVVRIVRERFDQLRAISEEQTGLSTGTVLAGWYRLSAQAPWPEDLEVNKPG